MPAGIGYVIGTLAVAKPITESISGSLRTLQGKKPKKLKRKKAKSFFQAQKEYDKRYREYLKRSRL